MSGYLSANNTETSNGVQTRRQNREAEPACLCPIAMMAFLSRNYLNCCFECERLILCRTLIFKFNDNGTFYFISVTVYLKT